MSTSKPGDRERWRYEFQFNGRRYRKGKFRTKKLADDAERALRDRLTRATHGIPDPSTAAPTFTSWAGYASDYATKRLHLTDPATFDRSLRNILKFWGAKPDDAKKTDPKAVYHDLTLDAPLRDGTWLLKFEDWMTTLELAGSTKNHYRSACSRMYWVAMQPEYRALTGITLNPFRGILRDPTRRRETTLTREQIQGLLAHGTQDLQLAITLALLAPKLRLGNIVRLTWAEIDADYHWIRISDHKTRRHTQRPLVSPITPLLKRLLKQVRARQPKAAIYVLGDGVTAPKMKHIQQAFKAACSAIRLPYGTRDGEVSFHTLRHTATTLLAERGVSDTQRRDVLGHLAIQTTAGYTHLSPLHEIPSLKLLQAEYKPVLAGKSPASPPKRTRAKTVMKRK